MIDPTLKTSDFSYDLPRELIASHPLPQRDASRMLVVQGDKVYDKHIRDFLDYLQPGDVVVFNNSRVIPARFKVDANREMTLHTATRDGCWWGFCRKYNKLKPGHLFKLADDTLVGVVSVREDVGVKLKFITDDVMACLERVGKMPLPPYMKREEETEDRERYQTVYAHALGSMAAPTAGLHFTPELIEEIKKRGAKVVKITLHVGAGTWKAVTSERVADHKMHSEWGRITQKHVDIINKAKRVIAVGTTSLRLLETAARNNPCRHRYKRVAPFMGTTRIFITPGFKFRAVDVLLTNFHLPQSTLFMLVSAFSGLDQMKAAYSHAVAEKYRFFSYGDCCLLFKQEKGE